ncbi:MAG TPA: hypothetical protein VG105_02485, partial [Paraburkholderia sp.]|nr:hypothetical protein [Paraburkholderia sp.]
MLERLRREEVGAKRYQRRIAQAKKGSANGRKLVARLARKKAYAPRARNDFAHKVSHGLATSDAQFFVLEDLRIQSMTRAPKARLDQATGKWRLPNGAREGGAEPGDSGIVLGPHPPHARLQGGAPQQAGRPGAGGVHESGMFPLRAHSPGQPGGSAVCLSTLRFRGAC